MTIDSLNPDDLIARDFLLVPDLLRAQAKARPDAVALVHRDDQLTFAELDALVDRIAAGLQRDGIKVGDTVAACASSSIAYGATYFGVLRAGATMVPLAPSSTPEALAAMLADSAARLFFVDKGVAASLGPFDGFAGQLITFDDSDAGRPFSDWLPPAGAMPAPVEIDRDLPFNIIYSSGTTGTPKGIVQSHRMRWNHVQRGLRLAYGPDAVAIVSTPLYSNTTLVSYLPTIALGGKVVLMEKFDAEGFLRLAEKHRATHAMLVPVQYRRIMALPNFDDFDLSSFTMKQCTSAPFATDLKAEVLRRWPGALIESYGMTEGGGVCALPAHLFPDKLHTVGRPSDGHDIRLIDEEGREVGPGEIGEIVGHSPSMMNGYHNQPEKTRETEWIDPTGKRFIRTGDVGRFDEDGFLTLMDRKKDMIISGGFNIYPSDLEGVVAEHPAVAEVAVVGVPSIRWGETPVAFVVLHSGQAVTGEAIREWANAKLGKMQRVAEIAIVETLPRSAIGKVLKRELRDSFKLSDAAA